jgi:hypothetical protein
MEHSPDGKAYLVAMGAEVNDPHPRPCLKLGPIGTAYVTNPDCEETLQVRMRQGEAADEALKAVCEPAFQQAEGRLWLCYSANYSSGWNGVDLKIHSPGGRYGLCLHEVKLLGPGENKPTVNAEKAAPR